jgi:hypothetical protein
MGEHGLDSSGSGYGPLTNPCEHGKKNVRVPYNSGNV